MGLPKYAEHSFAAACSLAEAVPHRPDEDQNGWDYMVEFDHKNASGHSDTHPAAAKAFVQVKSSINRGLACTVKLSNALKAAQSKWPWFLVLYIAADKPRKPTIYAKHIWQQELEQTLREVRLAEKAGLALNRKKLRITFDRSDYKSEDELIRWMEECIECVKPDYGQQKEAIYKTVGFEGGHAVGNFNFVADDEETLFTNFLGLGDGLTATQFVLRSTRFGIEDEAPSVSFNEATVYITPSSVGECEIRLRGPSFAPMISIPAKVYTLGEPIVTSERRILRFSGMGVEIVWSLDGHAKFELNLNYKERRSLPDIEKLATLMKWCEVGPVDVQVWSMNGGRMIAGEFKMDAARLRRFDWEKLVEVTKMLRLLAGSASENSLAVSITDFNLAAGELYFMHQIIGAPSLAMEFIPLLDLPLNADNVLYYLWADVGDLTAYALMERPVRKLEDLTDGRKRMEFGGPHVRESWIVRDATQRQRTMIEGDYNRLIESMQNMGRSPFELGDIRQIYKQGLAERNSRSDGTVGS